MGLKLSQLIKLRSTLGETGSRGKISSVLDLVSLIYLGFPNNFNELFIF